MSRPEKVFNRERERTINGHNEETTRGRQARLLIFQAYVR